MRRTYRVKVLQANEDDYRRSLTVKIQGRWEVHSSHSTTSLRALVLGWQPWQSRPLQAGFARDPLRNMAAVVLHGASVNGWIKTYLIYVGSTEKVLGRGRELSTNADYVPYIVSSTTGIKVVIKEYLAVDGWALPSSTDT